jgi:serine/threonine-protein phosphatase 2A regulatory subunit A
MPMARSLAPHHDGLPTMSAFELWKTQIESENQEAAVDAMKRLSCVAILTHQPPPSSGGGGESEGAAAAEASNNSNSNNNILSYLNTWVQAEQPADELLLLLGKELPLVLSVIKQSHNHSTTTTSATATDQQQQHQHHNENTVSLLEKLASTEETVVRDQSVIVMNGLIVSGEYDNHAFLALYKRLASADWFTARVSAAGLAGALLQAFNNDLTIQHDILNLYKEMSNTDQTPMVRRAAAKHLGSVLKHAGWAHRDTCNWILQSLAATEQDSIRMLAIGALGDAGDSWMDHPTWTAQNWLPLLKDGATDLSWYVFIHSFIRSFVAF